MDDFLERVTVDLPLIQAASSLDCPVCGHQMRIVGTIDRYECLKCGTVIDMTEDEDGY